MIRAVVLVFVALSAWAQVAVPPLTARVTDLTSTLTREQQAGLERMLQEFEARKGSQLAVLMVPSTKPEAIEQYALRVGEQWKIGRKKVDDGAILVVAKDDRALRVEVGYGLEGVLNDATANRIIREIIVPRFREGDFYGGINAGLDRMIRLIDGEPLPEPASAPAAQGGWMQLLPMLLVAALIGGAILRAMLGRFLGAAATGGAVGFLAWMLAGAMGIALIAGVLAFVFTLGGGGGMGRRFGGLPGMGFPRGGAGWGGGGLGGGGFRGGGGGFGGGGASGRW